MSKTSQMDQTRADSPLRDSRTPAPVNLDWRLLAEQRLTRLVEIEHDHSVMLDRLALVQVDYLEVVIASAERLAQLGEIGRDAAKLKARLRELEHEHHRVRESYDSMCQSRSWRMTRPLRVVSTWLGGRGTFGSLARHMLRISWVRRSARAVVKRMPALHERLRSRLYGQARRK